MNYHNITYPDMNNGSGLRVVLWLSGCSHHCYNCQNIQTWDANSGILFDELAKEELFRELNKDYISGLTLTGGDPLHEANLDGVLDIVTEFNKRYRTTLYIAHKEDRNHNILNENSDEIRLSFPQKTIWLYTGYSWEDVFGTSYWNEKLECDNEDIKSHGTYTSPNMLRRLIVSKCDVVVDGRYVDSLRDVALKWKGSSNQRVIDVKETLRKNRIVLHD